MGCKKRFPADRKQSIGRVIFFIKISVRKAYLNPCQSYVKLELLQSLITAGFIRNGTDRWLKYYVNFSIIPNARRYVKRGWWW